MHRPDDPLRQIPLFAGLSAKELEHIHRIATTLSVKAGDVLMEEGAVSHEMVIVISATLEVTRQGQHIADIGKGGVGPGAGGVVAKDGGSVADPLAVLVQFQGVRHGQDPSAVR